MVKAFYPFREKPHCSFSIFLMGNLIFSSVKQLRKTDLLRFNNCLFYKDFFEFVEKTHQNLVTPYYFTRFKEKRLMAFSPGFIQKKKIPVTFDLDEYLGDDAKLKKLVPVEKVLLMHTPFRLRSEILGDEREHKSELLRHIDQVAFQNECDAVVFPFVLEHNKTLHEALAGAGYIRSFYEADFYLKTDFDTYDDFLSSLDGKVRKQYLNDKNRLKKHNVSIDRVSDVSAFKEIFYEMHKSLMKKYHHKSLEFKRDSFEEFTSTIENSICFIAHKDGKMLGYSLSIHDTDTLYCLRCCQSHEMENARVYFNLLFETSVKKAIELGCKSIGFGKESHRTKMLRGCSYDKGFVYVRFLDSAKHALFSSRVNSLDRIKKDKFKRKIFPST